MGQTLSTSHSVSPPLDLLAGEMLPIISRPQRRVEDAAENTPIVAEYMHEKHSWRKPDHRSWNYRRSEWMVIHLCRQ